jgi:hypothetical protein
MKSPRFSIELADDELDELAEMARLARRHPREQAAVLVVRGLRDWRKRGGTADDALQERTAESSIAA